MKNGFTMKMKRAAVLLTALLLIGGPFAGRFASAAVKAEDVLPARLSETITNSILGGLSQIDLASFGLTYTPELKERIDAFVFNENPEWFFVASPLTYIFREGDDMLVRIDVSYRLTAEEYAAQIEATEAAAAELLSGVAGNGYLSDAQKALLVHDRLAVLCEYDMGVYQTSGEGENARNIYGALVERKAVCDGYARAYNYLMAYAGIPCFMVGSDALNHSWNIVCIDGVPYHVDVTYDDPPVDRTGRVGHDNFLNSSKALYAREHAANDYDTTPSDTRYDDAVWTDSYAPFVLAGGGLYYIDNVGKALKSYQGDVLAELPDDWDGYSETARRVRCLSRLATDGTYLFFNDSTSVYRYDIAAGEAEAVFTPEDPGGKKMIFGMNWEDGKLICDFTDSPGSYAKADKRTFQVTKACPAHQHAWDQGRVVTPATADAEGTIVYTCTVCRAMIQETIPPQPEGPATPARKTGDVDGDGKITSGDARLALRASVGLESDIAKGTEAWQRCDVDDSGSVTSGDARLILRGSVGLEDTEKWGKK